MEAGELVVRGFEFGGTTEFVIVDPGPQGLGVSVRTQTQQRMLGGATAGYDVAEAGEVQIPLLIAGDATRELSAQLRAAFRAMRTGEEELTLSGVLPGVVSIFGRPAGVDVDLTWPTDTLALARFAKLDPLLYAEAVAVELVTSSPQTIDVAGTADTDRVVITLVGNGGIPGIIWTPAVGDSLGVIDFDDVLAVGDVAVLDVRARTLTIEGDLTPEALGVYSSWLRFEPGENTLQFADCASMQVTYRPAFA
jgi:hypothetical protein